VDPAAQPPADPAAQPPVDPAATQPTDPAAQPPVDPAAAQPPAQPVDPAAQPPVDPAAQPPVDPAAQPPVDPAAQPPAGQPPAGQPPAGQPPAEGQAAAGFAHGLVPNTIVYAFEEKPIAEGGRFLGEFKVVEAQPGNPTFKLAPNLPLTEAQSQHLAEAKGPWTLYMTMPTDNAGVFAQMDEAQRAALLPAESAAEFAKSDRPLVDYHDVFHEHYVQTVLLGDFLAHLEGNIKRTTEATERVVASANYRQAEKEKVQADLEKFRFEADAIARYQQALEGTLKSERDRAKARYVENRHAAAVLTRSQLQAVETIDRRTTAASP
jgi:hypothetical protein